MSAPNQHPLVCITVINYNRWADTVRCARSLASSDYTNSRLLIVDNGSGDDSADRLRAEVPEAQVIVSAENLGFAAGQNLAFRHALQQGPSYIWMLNNDTIVHSTTLRELVECAESDPGLGAVGCVVYHMSRPDSVQAWGGGRLNWRTSRVRYERQPVTADHLTYLTGASMLLRRQALESVGPLDEQFFMYWEDVDLCVRLRSAGWRLGIAERARLWHEESATAVKGSTFLDYHFNRSAVRFFRKHSRAPARPLMIGIARRLAKRLITGRWRAAASLWRGVRDA